MQLLSSLGYAAAAAANGAGKTGITAAALFENFAAGLGTAAFLAFLMSVCERRYAATQFALLSAIYALSRWASGTDVGGAGGAAGVRELLPAHLPAGPARLPAAAAGADLLDASPSSHDQPRPRAIAVAASTMRITSTAWM